MKKIFTSIIIICLSGIVFAANNILVDITTYKNGVPTIVDSLRMNARFYSNESPPTITDSSFLMSPTNFVWDTVIIWDVPTDVRVLKNYQFWFGNDVLYASEADDIRLDSVNFTDNITFGGDLTTTEIINALNADPIPVVPHDTTTTGEELAVKTDSTIYQGPGSSLTAEEIALKVDSVQTETHPGDWGGVGAGPNQLIVYVVDSAADDSLTGINVYAYNETGAFEAQGRTDSEGKATLKLYDGTYELRAGDNQVSYVFDDTLTYINTLYDTVGVLGYKRTAAAPSDPNLALFEGYLGDIVGGWASDVIITAKLVKTTNVSASTTGRVIGDFDAVDTTDAFGYFSFPLFRSMYFDDTTQNRYKISGEYVTINNLGRVSRISVFTVDTVYVPDTGNVNLKDLIKTQ